MTPEIAGRIVRGMAADASAHRPFVRVALATAVVLLVPLITAASWRLADFVAAGVLVAGTGLLLGGTLALAVKTRLRSQ